MDTMANKFADNDPHCAVARAHAVTDERTKRVA